MANKKYLLYIHSPKFRKEEKKSDLVNRLLDSYYSTPKKLRDALNSGNLIPESLPEISEPVKEVIYAPMVD